ncbi:MAG: hypothetical protein JNG88_16670 [Phycisphaerales bacterium]|nr:hypothetical protein [Phycisphaerales bacterium]
MQNRVVRLQRRLASAALGGVALGLITAFDTVDFGQIIASFLSQLFSVLITLLFGGQVASGL